MVAVCARQMCHKKTDVTTRKVHTHKNEEKSSLIEGYALFKAQGFIKRHKTTRICYLQTRIIDPTRLDSILTAYLNILAVLDSFISIYTLYKTKTQIIITGTHVLTP